MGKVRITGGQLRSRILEFSDGVSGLRPTPDRVRQTVFNWLGQDLTGKRCLDLFAGSGALGIEAISRGAKIVTMIENNKQVIQDLLKYKRLFNLPGLEIIAQDSIFFLLQLTCSFDVIFLDPPYSSDLLNRCLNIIYDNQLWYKHSIIYVEYNGKADLARFKILKSAKAGAVRYALLQLTVE